MGRQQADSAQQSGQLAGAVPALTTAEQEDPVSWIPRIAQEPVRLDDGCPGFADGIAASARRDSSAGSHGRAAVIPDQLIGAVQQPKQHLGIRRVTESGMFICVVEAQHDVLHGDPRRDCQLLLINC